MESSIQVVEHDVIRKLALDCAHFEGIQPIQRRGGCTSTLDLISFAPSMLIGVVRRKCDTE